MSSSAEDLYRDALALPEDDRRRLAKRLLASISGEDGAAITRAWDDELLDRLSAAERGEVETREWDDVRRELRAKHSPG